MRSQCPLLMAPPSLWILPAYFQNLGNQGCVSWVGPCCTGSCPSDLNRNSSGPCHDTICEMEWQKMKLVFIQGIGGGPSCARLKMTKCHSQSHDRLWFPSVTPSFLATHTHRHTHTHTYILHTHMTVTEK